MPNEQALHKPFTMHEIAVTLSDYVLTIECAILSFLLLRKSNTQWIRALFFFSVGMGSLLGGTVHGFFPDKLTLSHNILWKLTLSSIGVTGLCGWTIGANLILKEKHKVPFVAGAIFLFFFFFAYVIITPLPGFHLAIIYYLPPTIFLLVCMIYQWRKKQNTIMISGIIGISLTFVAAIVQQAKLMIHPVYFDHNVFYHILQGIAFWLIYRTFRDLEYPRPTLTPLTTS